MPYSNSSSVNNVITLYGAGGAGLNIVSELEVHRGVSSVGFAELVPCYIDTSRSNLIKKSLPAESIHLFEGIDGSGKVRGTNHEVIAKSALGILQKFKPTGLNIVVHSGSGGSGGILGPILVSELKARGEQVIVIVIGSTDTRIEIENTIKTLKSYESIAKLRGSPVVTHYVENSKGHSRFAVNKEVKGAISLLQGLFSGHNEELDTADLKSWLNYLTFNNGQPQLASLNFVTDGELREVGDATSVATLAMPDMNTRLDKTPAYQCVGYAPASWRVGAPDTRQMINDHPIHYVISSDFITRANNSLTTALKEVDASFASHIARPSILSHTDQVTESGLVL